MSVAIGSRNCHTSLPLLSALHSYTWAPSACMVTMAVSPDAAIASGTCALTGDGSAAMAAKSAKAAVRIQRSLIITSPSGHRLLQIIIYFVQKSRGGQPFLVGSDQQRQILCHIAGFDRVHAHFFQGLGEARKLPVV